MQPGKTIRVCGWVEAWWDRELSIRDSTGVAVTKIEELHEPMGPGDVVEIIGTVVGSGRLNILQCTVLTRALPYDATAASRSFSRLSFLRFRIPEQIALFRQITSLERVVRDFLYAERFIELRPPVLWRSIQEYGEPELRAFGQQPEFDGCGYALLQSPEPPALLGAIGGIDRSFQFAPCFRAEGAIPNPSKLLEFTQLNLTLTFTTLEEGKSLVERMLSHLVRAILDDNLATPFPSLAYSEAIRRYSTDTPDYRYPSYLHPDIAAGDLGRESGRFCGLLIPRPLPLAAVSKVADALQRQYAQEFAIEHLRADGISHQGGRLTYSGNPKSLVDSLAATLPATLVILPAPQDKAETVFAIITKVVHRFVTATPVPRLAAVWVEDFPFFRAGTEGEEVSGAFHRSRAIFGCTSLVDYPDKPLRVSQADLILNGVEVAGLGEREYRHDRFWANLKAAGVEDPRRYGYHMDALTMGAPPILNVAIGWDRLLWKLLDTPSLYDVRFLPKDNLGRCPVAGLPQSMTRP